MALTLCCLLESRTFTSPSMDARLHPTPITPVSLEVGPGHQRLVEASQMILR